MILSVQHRVHHAITEAVRKSYGIDTPSFSVEVPPSRAMGDLGVTVAFQLARSLKKAPRIIAQELAASLGDVAGISRSVVAPNGYLNLFHDRRGKSNLAGLPSRNNFG